MGIKILWVLDFWSLKCIKIECLTILKKLGTLLLAKNYRQKCMMSNSQVVGHVPVPCFVKSLAELFIIRDAAIVKVYLGHKLIFFMELSQADCRCVIAIGSKCWPVCDSSLNLTQPNLSPHAKVSADERNTFFAWQTGMKIMLNGLGYA